MTEDVKKILTGHESKETAYVIEDYPWGYKLRTTMYVWIESVKGKGDRVVRQTIDPKTDRLCKPKASTYSPFKFLYLDDNGHVHSMGIDAYDRATFPAKIDYLINKIEVANDAQIYNLRSEIIGHLAASYPYVAVKYSDEKRPAFKEWTQRMITHIKKAEITEWFDFEPAPEQDNPEGEVVFKVRTY